MTNTKTEEKKIKHSETCTCQECDNQSLINRMRWWAFTDHRGYMESPQSFDSYEEAKKWLVEFTHEHGELYFGYIVFGEMFYQRPQGYGKPTIL